jgi:Transposase DDE domain
MTPGIRICLFTRRVSAVILNDLFRPFIEQRPLCVMARGILERLLDPQRLNALFEQTAQVQYTRELLFSTTVELMAQVVLGRKPSVHAAYQALADTITVSDTAVYDKLQRMELTVSSALVRDSANGAAPLIRALKATQIPWLEGYHAKVIDGNHLEATEHRIAELRTTWAAPLPGKGLVILDQPTLTVSDILLTEDGQAQERSLLPDVLPLVQPKDLWLADRNFCTLKFLFGIATRGACFAIRQHGTVVGELLGKRQAKGRCPTGKVFEQKLRLGDGQGQTWVVRRITVELDKPTSDGDTEIHILTNLPVKDARAARVAELYRGRWTIEGLFLEVERTLECEIKTLAYPKAALFAFCVGLVAANAVAVLKAALRAAHGEEKASALSAYYLTGEIRETYEGMMIAIPAVEWLVFADLKERDMAKLLRDLAAKMVLARYRKHPRGRKKKTPTRRRYRNGEHVATSKLLAERNCLK